MRRYRTALLALGLLAASCSGAANDASPPTSTPATIAIPVATTNTPTPAPPASTTTLEETLPATTSPDVEPNNVGGEPGQANVDQVQAFMTVEPADDGPFYMVNLIRYRDHAEYADGRETDLTGEEADAIYGEYMRTTRLPEMGAEIMYLGEVEQDLIGGTSFDHVAVVMYPSRAAFVAMATDPEFQAMNVHKQAGVADTVVMATSLLPTPSLAPLDTPPFPANDEDPPFAFVHVFDYRETAKYQEGDADADNTRPGAEAVGLYSANAGTVAMPLGVRPVAWFNVEATIIGPPNVWDEVRINLFPSHATFDALASDTTWAAGTHHRTAGLNATYAIQTLPIVNGFTAE